MDKILEALIIGLIGIIMFLFWISLNISQAHQEISKIRKLLVSISDNNRDDAQHIGNTKPNIKGKVQRLIREKLNKHNNYEIGKLDTPIFQGFSLADIIVKTGEMSILSGQR